MEYFDFAPTSLGSSSRSGAETESSVPATAPTPAPPDRAEKEVGTTVGRAPPMQLPTMLLDGLELGMQVGCGSLGSVRAAWLGSSSAEPAVGTCIKRLPLGEATVREVLEREVAFLTEARHDNLRSVLGLALAAEGGSAPRGGLFCELCHLCLPDLLEEMPLDPDSEGGGGRAVWAGCLGGLSLDMARGLSHLHAEDLTHRALKPSNVLLQREGRAGGGVRLVAKLADWAVLPLLRGTPLYARGAPHLFLAPEQLKEHDRLGGWPTKPPTKAEAVDVAHRAADVWSLGCLLATLAAREPPFPSLRSKEGYRFQNFKLSLSALKELTGALAMGRERPCASLAQPAVRAATPPAVAELAEDCTAIESEARPTAADILARLEAPGAAGGGGDGRGFELPAALLRPRRWDAGSEGSPKKARGKSMRFADTDQLTTQMKDMPKQTLPPAQPKVRRASALTLSPNK